jgi:hypothetical protein
MKAEADPDFGLGRGDLNIFFNISVFSIFFLKIYIIVRVFVKKKFRGVVAAAHESAPG